MNKKNSKKANILINYSPEDEDHFKVLNKHLHPLLDEIEVKTINSILPGENIDKSIDSKIKNSKIVIHLLSRDFLSDKKCLNICEKTKNNEDKFNIPILLSACYYQALNFKEIILPRSGNSILSEKDQNLEFTRIIIDIKKLLDNINDSYNEYDFEISLINLIDKVLKRKSTISDKNDQALLTDKTLETLENISTIIGIGSQRGTTDSFFNWYTNKIVLEKYLTIIYDELTQHNGELYKEKAFNFIQKHKRKNILVSINYHNNREEENNKIIEFENQKLVIGNDSNVTLGAVQGELSENEAIIEYVVLPSLIFIITITSTACSFNVINKSKEIISNINYIKSILKNLNTFNEELLLKLNKIYDKIFSPTESKLKGINKLYIIADEEILTVPFEALVTRIGDTYDNTSYLLSKYEISYHYSTWFLYKHRLINTAANKS